MGWMDDSINKVVITSCCLKKIDVDGMFLFLGGFTALSEKLKEKA